MWKHLGPISQGVPCCHPSLLCHSETEDTMGAYHHSEPQGKFREQNAQTDVGDPCPPAFQTGPELAGCRPPSLLLSYSPWCSLSPCPQTELKLKSWAHWLLCHRIRHFLQICCLWQKHFLLIPRSQARRHKSPFWQPLISAGSSKIYFELKGWKILFKIILLWPSLLEAVNAENMTLCNPGERKARLSHK